MWNELDLIHHQLFGVGVILEITLPRIRVFFIDTNFEAVLDLPICSQYGLLQKNTKNATPKEILYS